MCVFGWSMNNGGGLVRMVEGVRLYVMKLMPQPQASLTLGLLNTNCADSLSST